MLAKKERCAYTGMEVISLNQPFFTGACTALVTPFLHGEINYPLLERLIRRQCEAGIQAIVIAGTTGESPTLSDLEKLELFRRAKEYAGNDCKILAGTGSNDTEHAVTLSKAAEEVGADALLVVSPYYNKATAEGLAEHYARNFSNASNASGSPDFTTRKSQRRASSALWGTVVPSR